VAARDIMITDGPAACLLRLRGCASEAATIRRLSSVATEGTSATELGLGGSRFNYAHMPPNGIPQSGASQAVGFFAIRYAGCCTVVFMVHGGTS
jgi:hypothetical protein